MRQAESEKRPEVQMPVSPQWLRTYTFTRGFCSGECFADDRVSAMPKVRPIRDTR
jgi:hypothetical protein